MKAPLTQEELESLPDGTVVMFAGNGGNRKKWILNSSIRSLLRRYIEKGCSVDVRIAPPTAGELAAALRELHDFAEPSTHYRHAMRSEKAFKRAAELLERMGK